MDVDPMRLDERLEEATGPELDEAELSRLQNEATAVLGEGQGWRHGVGAGRAVDLVLAVPTLCDEVRRLRQLLIEYGCHNAGCSGQWPEYRCKCGWREVEGEFR
jgi:hypothetical protein